MSFSVTIEVDSKPVTLVFNDANVAIRVLNVLQTHLEIEETEEDELEQQEAQKISSFLLEEPLFVDLAASCTDHRLQVSTEQLCRIFSASDNQTIEEVHSIERPKFAIPTVPFSPPPLPVIAPPPPIIHPVEPQINMSTVPHEEEQLFKPIETLFMLCQKNEHYMHDLANFARLTYSPDKDSQIKICFVATSKLFELPLNDRIQMIKKMPFDGELKEKVVEILMKQKQEQEKREKDREREAEREKERIEQEKHKKVQNQISDNDKVKQVLSVLRQLQPEAISKLLHGQQPAMLVSSKQGGYKMVFTVGPKIIKQENQSSFDNELLIYNSKYYEKKEELWKGIKKDETVETQVKNLFEKYSSRHMEIYENSEIAKFHKNFTLHENALILLKIKASFERETKLYNCRKLIEELAEKHSIFIFEQLKQIVDQHKNVQQIQPAQKQPEVKKAAAPQPPPPVVQKPKIKPTVPAVNQSLTTEEEEILQEVEKAQDNLKIPEIGELEELQASIKPSVISKVFTMILGLGYEYHHYYLLEENLLFKLVEDLNKALNLEIPDEELQKLIDLLLKSLIVYILERQNDKTLPLFESKEKPELVKIAPELEAEFEVKEFFYKYEENIALLKQKLTAGQDFDSINSETEFIVFTREDLTDMFENVNIFGDLLDAISLSEK